MIVCSSAIHFIAQLAFISTMKHELLTKHSQLKLSIIEIKVYRVVS